MTELLSGSAAPSDAELIARVRGGDLTAYGELFERHVEAARRLARQLMRGPDVDDLVSDAFARTLTVLQGGGGPDVAFRAYLLTSVRRIHVDRIRAARRVQPADDMTAYDPGVAFHDPAVADFENGAAARAFRALPERWQLVLWHLEVEGQKPADIAPLLGMSANSVSALAYRAREGLRQAFLTMHATDETPPECRWVTEHLGGYVRNGLSRRDSAKVDAHLKDCRRCTAVYLELTEVNSNLAGIIGPLLLGAVASAYATAGGSSALGVSALVGRVRDLFGAHTGGAAAGGSGVATGGGVLGGGSGLLAGGALTSSGALAIGGIAAAAVAVTTTAALVLGGGAPAGTTSPAVAGSEASTAPSPGLGASGATGATGATEPAGTGAGRTGDSSGATDPSSAAGRPAVSTPAEPLDGTATALEGGAAPRAGSASAGRAGGGRVAGARTEATGSSGTGEGDASGRDRSGRGAGAPAPEARSSWPAVEQPTDAPGPPPYGSDAPVVEKPAAPASPGRQEGGRNDDRPGRQGSEQGGEGTGQGSGGASSDTTGGSRDEESGGSGAKGRGSRGNAGPGRGNDNGHHWGRDRDRGHERDRDRGRDWGHDRGRGHDEDRDRGRGHGKGHDH